MTTFRYMFYDQDNFMGDLSNWNTSSLRDMYQMFYSSHANPKISNWDVSKVTNMERVFDHAYSFNHDISSWTFPPLQEWITCSTTRRSSISPLVRGMFLRLRTCIRCSTVLMHLISPLVRGTFSVTNMQYMFHHADVFNQPIGSWDVSSVTNMHYMFEYAPMFAQSLESWPETSVTTSTGSSHNMFHGATAFHSKFSCPSGNHGPPVKCTCSDLNLCMFDSKFLYSVSIV